MAMGKMALLEIIGLFGPSLLILSQLRRRVGHRNRCRFGHLGAYLALAGIRGV